MDEPMDTALLVQRLDEFNSKLELSAKERHAVNGKVHGALSSIFQKTEILTEKTDRQDTVLGQLSDSVQQITEAVQRIEEGQRGLRMRLIGDESLQSTGVIQEQADQKAKITAHDVLLGELKNTVSTHKTAYESDKRFIAWLVGVLATLGALITWAQNSGIFKLLIQPGK